MMINSFKQTLYQTAEGGQTSYFFDMTNMTNTRKVTSDPKQMRHMQTYAVMNSQGFNHIPQTTMSNEEIVTRFQLAFPDCSVRYGEDWIESNVSTKVLKRGITIDWS